MLRPYQKKALKAVTAAFKKEDRAQLIMACGTGKTLTGLAIVEDMKARRTLVLLPSLALVSQTLAEYQERASRDFDALSVCSDEEVGHDITEVTTCPEEISTFLRRRKNPLVLFCTYQSSALLEGHSFDLALYDEAHKTSGNKEKAWAKTLQDKHTRIKKRLFMTATPRVVRKSSKNDKIAYSMDDEKTYGSVAYRLSFREAVEVGAICDYKIVVSVVFDDGLEVEKQVRPLAVALHKAMKKTKAKKAFTFHRTVKEARAFRESSVEAGLKAFSVDGGMHSNARAGQLESFKNARKAVMTNARCLIEGVDLPSVDMVCFADPKRSTVDIVQAAGRAMRKAEGKTHGSVFIPLYLRSDESIEEGLDRTKYDQVYSVLQALQEHDEVLAEALIKAAQGDKKALEEKLVIECPGGVEGISIDSLRAGIGSRILDRLVNSAGLNKRKLLEMARNGEERPNNHKEKLGSALSRYTGKKSGTYDPAFDKAIRKAAPRWFMNSADLNKKKLLEMAQNGEERPNQKTKLGSALCCYTRKKSSTYDPDFDEAIRKAAPGWSMNSADLNKKKLLEIARSGEGRPNSKKTKLGTALGNYIGKKSRTYDPAFDKAIRKAAPHWFRKSTKKKKAKKT